MKKRLIRILIILSAALTLTSCGGMVGDSKDGAISGKGNVPAGSSSKEITYFGFATPSSTGIIDESAKTIAVTVPYGTDRISLAAEFTTTGAETTVNGVEQVSGVTINNFISPVKYTVTAKNGSMAEYSVSVYEAANSSKDIILFEISGQSGSSITGTSIVIIMPYGTDKTSLTPVIAHTGAGISPASGVAKDFTNPLTYTVTAADGSTKNYIVKVTVSSSSAKDINSFTILGMNGTFSGTDISVTVPYGSNKASLVPTISHTGTGISPASGVAQDFTNPVTYTVTAADGSTKDYTVTVNVAANSAKEITEFTITGQNSSDITGTDITVTMPYGTDKTSLTPAIIHTGAGINPASGVAQNFTNSVVYTVTAENGTTQAYTVTVTVAADSWLKTFGGTYSDIGYAICSDSSGNIYVTGQCAGNIDFGNGTVPVSSTDIFIAKYSSSGTCLWVKIYGSMYSGSDSGLSLCTDLDNNLYVTGEFGSGIDFDGNYIDTNGGTDIFIVKYSPSGDYLWSKTIGGTGDDSGNAVSIDPTGYVYIAGKCSNGIDFGNGSVTISGKGDAFILKLSLNGECQEVKTFGADSVNYADIINSICVDSSGNIIAAGTFYGTAINFGSISFPGGGSKYGNFFIVKYSSIGDYIWAKTNTAKTQGYGNAVSIDSSDNVYFGGCFSGKMDFGGGTVNGGIVGSGFLIKYSSDGKYFWGKILANNEDSEVWVSKIIIDPSGDLFMTGNFTGGPVNFGGGDVTSVSRDVFLVKYNTNGIFQQLETYTNGTGFSVCIDSFDNIYITGDFYETVNYGHGEVTSNGYGDVFILKN